MSTTDPRGREEIDHEAEALARLRDSAKRSKDGFQHLALVEATAAQASAVLALVAVQREANEQARVASIIALAFSEVRSTTTGLPEEPVEAVQQAWNALVDVPAPPYRLRPEIAKALGIGGDDE